MELNSTLKGQRFYFLDWLRVIAFSILLLEHCAEVFTSWNFAIKNVETSYFLDVLVMFFKPWRMPLLFMVSGAAVFLSFKSRTFSAIIKERSIRLLVPLAFAMLIIIPPQIYYIRLGDGFVENFLDFYRNVFQFQWFPKGNFHWLHLWYLAFIFAFTLTILPVLHIFKFETWKKQLDSVSKFLSKPIVLLSLGVVLTMPYYLVKVFILNQNVSQLALFFPFFLFGALFLLNKDILESVKKYSNTALLLGVFTSVGLYLSLNQNFDTSPFSILRSSRQSIALFLFQTYNLWFWLIAFFGLGMRYLNYGSNALLYATQAVYPFYILHQTVIVAIAYYLIQWEASVGFKLFLLTADSFILLLFFYEFVIRRYALTRLLFGLKLSASQKGLSSVTHLPKGVGNNPLPAQLPLTDGRVLTLVKDNSLNESNENPRNGLDLARPSSV